VTAATAPPPAPTRPGRTRWGRAVLVGAVAWLAGGGVAHADPAEATDYESYVTSIVPPTDTVDVQIVGGDSFVQLTVEPGTEVVVTGYQGEPFLRVRADGTVEQNDRSPSVYLSVDRMGGSEIPAHADASLPPRWRPVDDGGRYAWHDHRAHWMSPDPPPDAEPGARIQDGVIPLEVDGAEVAVTVATDWLPAPSPVAVYVGAGLAVMAVVAILLSRRRLAWPLLVVAIAATGIGWWQYRSLPPETGPLLVWWLLPAIAAGSALAALLLGRRLVAAALVILAGLELAVWVYVRRAAAFRALIPTDAPFWLDRAVVAAAAVLAAVATVGGVVALYRTSALD
jgi:hypothetical protein